ncbi:MAG: internal scaffolding protein [Microvirus sp.]|nr:MAG: internal scaffolding protein [Microvirus sp.]
MTNKTQTKCEPNNKPLHSFRGSLRKIRITFNGPGRTLQQFKSESDINTIMGQYLRTGVLPPNYDPNSGQYIDATGFEYQAAMELVASANSMFHNLPSALRARFDNDPSKFLNYVENPDNAAGLAAMGLKRASESDARGGDGQATTPQTPPAKTSPTPLPASGEGVKGEGSQPAKPV